MHKYNLKIFLPYFSKKACQKHVNYAVNHLDCCGSDTFARCVALHFANLAPPLNSWCTYRMNSFQNQEAAVGATLWNLWIWSLVLPSFESLG